MGNRFLLILDKISQKFTYEILMLLIFLLPTVTQLVNLTPKCSSLINGPILSRHSINVYQILALVPQFFSILTCLHNNTSSDGSNICWCQTHPRLVLTRTCADLCFKSVSNITLSSVSFVSYSFWFNHHVGFVTFHDNVSQL